MKLPVLVSIPHGGTVVPSQVSTNLALSAKDLFDDTDAFTSEIYCSNDLVAFQLKAQAARAFVDLNRRRDDRRPDGAIKTHTCFGKNIYKVPLENEDIESLLTRYYDPYHSELARILENEQIELMLDCHSMVDVAPKIAPDTGQKRPLICLGTNREKACPRSLADQFADCISKAFGIEREAVTIDHPFSGGFITQAYGSSRKIPCLQVEMNRSLYLSSPWFNESDLTVDESRLNWLNSCFRAAIEELTSK